MESSQPGDRVSGWWEQKQVPMGRVRSGHNADSVTLTHTHFKNKFIIARNQPSHTFISHSSGGWEVKGQPPADLVCSAGPPPG